MHYTFQASGSLWQDALVIQDLQTKSLWSQISGECIQGPREGEKLAIFPAFYTTFAEFAKSYPDGLLLSKPNKGEAGSVYQDYFSDSAKIGIFGRVETFEQLEPKAKIFGVRVDNHQGAVTLEYLETNNFALLSISDRMIIVTYDKRSETVAAFNLGQVTQTGRADFSMVDSKIALGDGTVSWEAFTGKLSSGTGVDLQSVPVITAFWFAWASFFPNSDLVE